MKEEKKEGVDDAVNCLLKLADVHTFTLEIKRHNFYKNSKASTNIKVGKIADEIVANLYKKFNAVEYEGCRSMVYDTIIKYLK